jgi:glycosyltransferase involved in cell wall biosynthesis
MTQTPRDRLAILLAELDPSLAPAPNAKAVAEQLRRALTAAGDDVVWLALAVLRAEFPVHGDVVAARRALRLEDAAAWALHHARNPVNRGVLRLQGPRPVRVVRDVVVVDVHHTARTGLATGIQRVVRKTIAEWADRHEVLLAGWGSTFGGLRELAPDERENALHGTKPHAKHPSTGEVTIPWRSRYILPELAIESERTARIAAMAEFSGNHASAIGFDCVPLTSAETTAAGMGAAFSRNLVALAHFDVVATISAAAGTEYEGWRAMLASAGLTGPRIQEVFLPIEVGEVDDTDILSAESVLLTGDLPLLLCVGSHEPRKNHLAVLAAAESLWAGGRDFSLVFVGGNSWGGGSFVRELEALQDRGRPVSSISAVTDELLYSGYRLAAATVFPSWNEGFGLPVAESIASGTPVVTSRFGSMAEIAEGGGALLVDPRNDGELREALDSVLFDSETAERLRAEARERTTTSWADYADDVWDCFTAVD